METVRPQQILGVVVLTVLGCRPPRTEIEGPGPPVDTPDAGDAGVDTRSEPPVIIPAPQIQVETLAGSSTEGDTEGEAGAAVFDNPVGVLLEPSGALLVTEYDGGRVRRVPVAGTTTTLAKGLCEPFAMLLTEDALYIQTDRDFNCEKGPTSGTIWKLTGTGTEPERFLEGLSNPRGLERLHDGRVVISDRGRHTLSILDLADKSMTLLAGSRSPGYRDGKGAQARFNEPYGLAILPDGNILVADSRNNCIRRVTVAGEVTTFAGDGNPGMKDDADKMKARFDGPIDVAVDIAGNAFVSDGGNHRIRRISTDGRVDTLAGSGQRGFADGNGADAQFYGQEQLDVSPDGKAVYVSDGNGGDGSPYHRIRKIRVP
jgi:DNA-binding beta-propeller fold protein YncE